ncbi:type I glyceraldehyde-3-phosphate dehydrogenase [Candidatus Falkowbacteria bacterium]|nr:MAG: type I glyceraldehyde-3-phosphate dehydrogenase [Candidatus Falkowbacteria bacterium]
MNIAINGFGRIGRAVFKALLEKPGVKVVAINDLTDTKTLAHLLTYDSVYGVSNDRISYTAKTLVINGHSFPVLAEKDPAALPWSTLKVDIVIESTGRFTDRDQAQAHITAGAKKVLLSAPGKGDDIQTYVIGVNENKIKKNDKIISMASCTTNCLAPVTDIIRKAFGIDKAIMTTIHSYTADQNLVDGPHKDLRRARAASLSMIPTTTGAALAVAKTIPSLAGRFDGLSVRVPTPVGSLCDAVYVLRKKTTKDQVNTLLQKASQSKEYKGIVTVTEDPIVSADIVGNPASAIVDLALTNVIGDTLLKVVSWYDNEWGYSNRLADLCVYINKKKLY